MYCNVIIYINWYTAYYYCIILRNINIYIYELPPKLYCPKMEYLFFLRFKGSPSFYKGFDQTFTNIRTVSRSHHFELLAAAMAKVVKKQCQDVPGCARSSTVTRRSDKGARRSNSGSASSRSGSSSSSSGVAVAVAVAVAVEAAVPAAVAAAVAAARQQRQQSQQSQQSQQVTASHNSSYQQLPAPAPHQHHTSTTPAPAASASAASAAAAAAAVAGAVGALLVLVRQMPAAKAQLGPAVAMVVVAVVAGWGKKVCQLLARFMPSCLSWILPSFLPSFWLRSRTQNQTGKRNRRMKRILAGGKQKLDTMQMQQEEKQYRKRKTGINRKKRRRKGSQQKLSQERHESKKGNKRKTRENR